ncbi:MliC family protein [Tsuneonella troitsensis]|uniref:MliC family protein n=1 Tax=Tsuneonella troitsensis TaxID=292222 RepID=UPI00070D0901|nr:MliC family protein [Tsuneonella troitsensis]
MKKVFGAVLLTAALAGCATIGPVRRVAYVCESGTALDVLYTGETARIMATVGKPIVLQQRETGSGFWYESPTHSLRGKGEEVTYTVGRMAPMTCREDRRQPR